MMKIGIALLVAMTSLFGTADFIQGDAQKAADRIVLEDFSRYPQGRRVFQTYRSGDTKRVNLFGRLGGAEGQFPR